MRHVLFIAFLLFVAACGERGNSCPCLEAVPRKPEPLLRLESRHYRGERPQRIVTLAPGLTEIIAYLDGVERLVGVSKWCDHPAEVGGIKQVAVMPLDYEGIVVLRPDLVVADNTLHKSALEQLAKRFGRALLVLETSRSLVDLRQSVAIAAACLGTAAARDAEAAFSDAHRAAVLEWKAPDRERPLRVLVVSEWDPLNVVGPFGLMHDMLRLAGCVNVACDTNMPSGPFSAELVLERRPDVILHRSGPPPERLRRRWRGVPAIDNEQLANCEADDLMRGGPRILEALARLRAVLHGQTPLTSLAAPR